MRVRILIAAGGSGGHIFPAIALARTLKEKSPDVDIMFVGTNKAIDKRIFEKEGFKFSLLSTNRLPYRISLQFVPFFVKSLFDTIKAFFLIVSYRPDAVVGFGGYVSCPILLVACIFGLPRIVHEQNAAPGRANKFLFRLASKVALSFDDTKKFMGSDAVKAVLTGNPIRKELFKDNRQEGVKTFGLDGNKFTILVIGGSQGAHFLNETFVNALESLNKDIRSSLQVIHITGIKDYEWAVKRYAPIGIEHRVHSFIDRIEDAYSASDLVITRSGASAMFELAFFGRPMILVPYPFAMSHQAENARVFSRRGAAVELAERGLSAEIFKDNIAELFNDRSKLKSLSENAKRLSIPEASLKLAEEVLAAIER